MGGQHSNMMREVGDKTESDSEKIYIHTQDDVRNSAENNNFKDGNDKCQHKCQIEEDIEKTFANEEENKNKTVVQTLPVTVSKDTNNCNKNITPCSETKEFEKSNILHGNSEENDCKNVLNINKQENESVSTLQNQDNEHNNSESLSENVGIDTQESSVWDYETVSLSINGFIEQLKSDMDRNESDSEAKNKNCDTKALLETKLNENYKQESSIGNYETVNKLTNDIIKILKSDIEGNESDSEPKNENEEYFSTKSSLENLNLQSEYVFNQKLDAVCSIPNLKDSNKLALDNHNFETEENSMKLQKNYSNSNITVTNNKQKFDENHMNLNEENTEIIHNFLKIEEIGLKTNTFVIETEDKLSNGSLKVDIKSNESVPTLRGNDKQNYDPESLSEKLNSSSENETNQLKENVDLKNRNDCIFKPKLNEESVQNLHLKTRLEHKENSEKKNVEKSEIINLNMEKIVLSDNESYENAFETVCEEKNFDEKLETIDQNIAKNNNDSYENVFENDLNTTISSEIQLIDTSFDENLFETNITHLTDATRDNSEMFVSALLELTDCTIVEDNSLLSDNDSLENMTSNQDEVDSESSKRHRTSLQSDTEEENEMLKSYFEKCNEEAEARLAARRQARAEAREIRMRELERQQKEQEENADRQYDMLAEPMTRTQRASERISSRVANNSLNNSNYMSSRRSSEDSLEDGGSLRDIRLELKELEEKFRKAMIANAQLDNDKAAQTYQLELLKDRIEELEEELSQLRREHREVCRENDQLKRTATRLKEEYAACKSELEERDRLIAEKGLVIVGEVVSDEDGSGDAPKMPKKALVSMENAELLESVGEGSLDVRLKKFAEEKRELMDQLSHLRLELEEERSRKKRRTSNLTANVSLQNGPSLESDALDVIDIQREANKQLADYKFRLQKSDQDIATLQATVARLESQVIRYKSAAEASEKAEDELKVEKRKLQREVKESQSRIEELETTNNHLQRRLDKVKNAKSALLKEL